MPSTKSALRKYQLEAFNLSKRSNAIIVLPTGSGKTLIAAALAKHMSAVSRKKILFLVPTCLLVRQQANSVAYETSLKVAEYMGGLSAPVSYDVLVSTPAAFLILNSRNESFKVGNFSLVIFDEVHHVIKRHPYRSIAKRIYSTTNPSTDQIPKILGLTASLTYAMGASKIQNAIVELCVELRLTGDCIFTVSAEQLVADGYHAQASSEINLNAAEKRARSLYSGNEINGINDNRSRNHDVNISKMMLSDAQLEIPGRPHESLPDFLRFAQAKKSPPLHQLTLQLMDTIKTLEAYIKSHIDPSFLSPIGSTGKRGKVGEWGKYANSQMKRFERSNVEKNHHSGEQHSPLRIGGNKPLYYNLLEHLYEATRLLVNSRQTALELAMHYLEMSDVFSTAGVIDGHDLVHPLRTLWESNREDFCRVTHLKEVLTDQLERFEAEGSGTDSPGKNSATPPSLRCIVFVQQRLTTHILQHAVATDEYLGRNGLSLTTDVIYATSSPATSRLSVSATDSRDRIARFATGEIQVLFATSVAEEGMDIPAANCVIRFDDVTTPVSLVQSRGRARQADSSFIILKESAKRPFSSLQSSEEDQYKAINVVNSSSADVMEVVLKRKRDAHESRIRSARSVLVKYNSEGLGTAKAEKALAALKLYAQKIAGEVTTQAVKSSDGVRWDVCLCLSTCNRDSVTGRAVAANKKAAIRDAAAVVLEKVISLKW